MTKRKDPRDAKAFDWLPAAIAHAHAWLNTNAACPLGAVNGLMAAPLEDIIELYRKNPHLLLELGAPPGEAPTSRSGLVRALLRELLAAQSLDQRTDLLRKASGTRMHKAAFVDDTRTRKALPLLAHGLNGVALLAEEAKMRDTALKQVGAQSDFNELMCELVRRAEIALQQLHQHARLVMNVDPPRTLAELVAFRAQWTRLLYDGRFGYSEIEYLLGYEFPTDWSLGHICNRWGCAYILIPPSSQGFVRALARLRDFEQQ